MLIEEQRRLGEQQLARIGADLEKKGQRFRALIKSGSPPQQITDTAKRQHVNLIIMATHGRTGLAHMFMGSVAEKVVRTASCPVLTVRAAAKQSRKAAAKKR
jgi:nucleotide-binding universal stress UspA family protein